MKKRSIDQGRNSWSFLIVMDLMIHMDKDSRHDGCLPMTNLARSTVHQISTSA